MEARGRGGRTTSFSAMLLVAALLLGTFASASASPYPAKVVSGLLSNAASAVVKRLWSLKSTIKTASGGKSMVKYEGGYTGCDAARPHDGGLGMPWSQTLSSFWENDGGVDEALIKF